MAGGMPAARHRAAFRQMATLHSLTIQNASEPFFKLPGSQLFLLSRPDGEVFGFDVSQPGLNAKFAQLNLKTSLDQAENAAWWYSNRQPDQGVLVGNSRRNLPQKLGRQTVSSLPSPYVRLTD